MKQFCQLNSRLVASFRLFVLSLTLFALFRFIFFLCFYSKAESFSANEAFKAFLYGARFDSRVAIFVTLPALILSLIQRFHWTESLKRKNIWAGFYAFVFGGLALIHGCDIAYYAYLEGRINFRIFEFFKNPLISLNMIYESYNVWGWSLVLVVFTFGMFWFLRKFIFYSQHDVKKTRRVRITQSVALSLFIILGVHNSFGQYPLRWSDCFFTQNMFITSLSMNPAHYIFDTAQNSRRDYDISKVKAFYKVMAPYLGVQKPDLESLNFSRPVELTPRFSTRPNIVYIVMESMAAYKTGLFGNQPDASPSLDQLARSGWLFRHFYTPTEGTARSLFCVLTGVPDINAKSTSSRNPLIVNQHTLINGLKGYEKFYFIGGSASWGNIRGVYMNNVDDLKMYEDEDLGGPHTDVWGLSDLDLFRKTAKVLAARDANTPFFALIQSASFHRPYTIPADHGTFELKTLTPEQLEKFGFASNAEYNSFRFADYSLGEFFRLVKNEEFFKNTIFIIHGDHGLPHYKAEHLSPGYKSFGLNRFHTPLVIYSPLIKKAEEFNMMVTEPDVMPTLLGLTGQEFPNRSLGRNVFALGAKEPHYGFSYVYYSDPLQIMLYDQKYLAFGTEKGIESLHLYQSAQPRLDVKDQFPEKFNEMRDILTGIFETSKYILHHNPRIKPEN